MERARELIVEHGSIFKAARQTGVPETTLRDRVVGKVEWRHDKKGPAPLLSTEGESLLAQHLLDMANFGYG